MNTRWTPLSELPPSGAHLDEDRLLDLLLGLAPEPLVGAAMAHLDACGRCEERLRLRGADLEHLRASGAPRFQEAVDRLPVTEAAWRHPTSGEPGNSMRPEPATAPAIPSRWWQWQFRPRRYALGFVSVLAAAAVVILVTTRRPESAAIPSDAAWLPSASETLLLRADAAARPDAALSGGLTAYDRHELPEAIRELSVATHAPSLEAVRRVFLGSALTQAGNYRAAVSILRGAPLASVPQPWREDAEWTFLVALHRAGREASADSLLRLMAQEPGEPGARARRLLGGPGR